MLPHRPRSDRPAVLRRPSRAGAAGVMAAVALGVPFMAVPAGAATPTPTINCDTAPASSSDGIKCRTLVGTAKCVWNNKDGSYTLAMGYDNPSGAILQARIPASGSTSNNAFTANQGFAANPGHSAVFYPGVYTTAFTVTWTPRSSFDPVTWLLMDETRNLYRTYTACPTKPVPVVGSAGGLALGAVGLTALLGIAATRRDRLVAALRRVPVVGGPGPGSP